MNSPKLSDIRKRHDPYATSSGQALKSLTEKKMKRIYVSALRCLEIKFGKDFPGYEEMRKEILRAGNDAIREWTKIVEENFNIEQIPSVVTIKFAQGRDEERTDHGNEDVHS